MPAVGLANLQVNVTRGSAMVEVADLVKGTTLTVNLNGATAQIEKAGLYAFYANQQVVCVLDGKVKVLDAARVKTIGKGDQIALAANVNLKAHGFDKGVAQADPLYVWSKARSEAEAEANVEVARTVAVSGGWYGPGWYWDPFWAEYAFLPGAGFLYSPFGWGFYSPAFVYAAPYGFYGRGFHSGHRYYGYRPGVSAAVHAGDGFHGGFAGGFHGGRGHR